MSITIVTRTTCDRCGFSASTEEERGRWAWMNAISTDQEGPRIGAAPDKGRFGDDLCPGCFESLLAWWTGVSEAVAQPAPPPVPPPALLNLGDRARAITVVTEALRIRTQFVLTVIRDEPTAILTGDIVPGTLFGIEDSAAGIVDGTLDALGLAVPGQRRRLRGVDAAVTAS